MVGAHGERTQPHQPSPGRIHHRFHDVVVGALLIGAGRPHQQEPSPRRRARDAIRHRQGARVAPVQVLECHDHRDAFGEASQDEVKRLQGPQAKGLRRERGQLGALFTEERGEGRHGLGRLGGRQAPIDDRSCGRRCAAAPSGQQVHEACEGSRPVDARASALQPGGADRFGRTTHLTEQPCLARARVAHEERAAAASLGEGAHSLDAHRELVLAPHQPGPARRRELDLLRVPRRKRHRRLDDRCLPLELQGPHRAPPEPFLHLPAGGGADEHLARVGARLQSRGDAHRVPRGAVLDPRPPTDAAHHHEAGLDTDPHPEGFDTELAGGALAVRPHGLLDLQPGPDRALRVVFVRGRCPEQGEDAVAGDVVGGLAEPLDHLADVADAAADQVDHVLGIEGLAERGRTLDVGEQRRDGAAFSADRVGAAHVREATPTRVPPGRPP